MVKTNRHFLCLRLVTMSLVFLFVVTETLSAQYFGKNKVVYEDLNFKVKETPNYDIYHYLDDDMMTGIAQLSERWYSRINQVFADTFPAEFVPVILYENHADFQQTVVIDQPVSIGLQGVTEGFRNRVVMPFNHSMAATNQVLGHELVHTFQYNLFTQTPGIGLRGSSRVPLWIVEGQAEYQTLGRSDPETAMWMRDAVISGNVPTFADMSRDPQQYFPYRYGYAALAFLTGEFGDHQLRPFLIAAGSSGAEAALGSIFEMDADTLSTLWAESLTEAYLPYTRDTTTAVGERLFHEGNAGSLNTSPVLSPDGSKMIFVSDRDIIEIDYYLADVETGTIEDRIGSQVRNMHVDFLSFMESPGTWSPDGRRLATTVFQGGINRLIITDIQSGRRLENIRIPGLEAFNNPAWSPDGRYIAVSGLQGGKSDLWVYDLEEEVAEKLTDDPFSNLQPSWSPDGSRLLFSSDRGEGSDLDRLIFGSHVLSVMDLETREITVLDVFPGANNLNPVFGPDGDNVYFLSDADGFRNLYEYDLDGEEVYRLTRLFTGISGIDILSPAFSLSQNGYLAYSYYRNGNYSIYNARLEDFEREQLDPSVMDQDAARLPPFEDPPVNIVQDYLQDYPLMDPGEFSDASFKSRFGLETIGSAGVGVGVNRFGVGASGGVSAMFNDILREHTLFSSFQLQGRLIDAGGQLAYFNQTGRFNWGGSFSHIPQRYMGASVEEDELDGEEVVNLQLMQERLFETQIALFSIYPFSRFHRVELGMSGIRYGFRRDLYENYYTPDGFFIGENREQIDAPEPLYLSQINLAYVFDSSSFGLTSPIAGARSRFELSSTLGDLQWFTALADYRAYQRVRPFTLAFRGYHYGRYGQDSDALSPQYLGSPFLVRGYGIRSFLNQPSTTRSLDINNQFGSRIAVANAEIRLPLTGPEELSIIPSRFLFSDLVLFSDAGIAWSDGDRLSFSWEADEDPQTRTPVVSAGVSWRVNLFGYLVLEPYVAMPFQREETSTSFGFFISGGGW